MIYKMTLKDSADEMTFDLLEVPIVDKDIEGAVDNVTLDGNQYTDYLWLKKQFIQKWSLLCDDEYTRLRGFYTRQFENADVPSYRLYYGDDIIRNSTLSGERIELSIGGVADGTMSLTQMDGNTIQDGTPTPSAPVPIETVTGRQTIGIVSKNLYDPNSTVFSVPANVSVEVEGNSVKVTALITTTSSNLYWRTPIPDAMLEDGKTYTISSVLGSGAYRSPRLLLRNHDGSNAGFSTGYSVTYDSRYTLFVVENPFATTGSTQVTAGTTCTISNIQVEEGSTATTFEPYKAQEYEINLGKNLFDKDNANVVRGYIAGTNLTGGTDYTIYIPCEESTTYTIQKMVAVPQTANRFRINSYAVEPTAGATSISSSYFWNAGDGSATTTHTYTTPTGAKYLGITVMTANTSGTTTADEMYASIQIEKGSIASPYSPYFEPIELCKIGTYQDRIYKENGKWWLHKELGKMVLDGTESWTWQPSSGYNRAGLTPTGAYIYTDTSRHTDALLSSHFTASGTNGYGIVFQYQEKTWFYPTADITTVADFKTWLGTALPSVYYPLATPTTTEITNEEVLEGLEALQDEAISVGLHNIYTDTPNALPTLTFDLTEYLSKSTTIIPETAVRLTLTDGGVINACGCRKDVQLTMRETIE